MNWTDLLKPESLLPILGLIVSAIIAILKYKGYKEAAAALEAAKAEMENMRGRLDTVLKSWDQSDAANKHLVEMIQEARLKGIDIESLIKMIREEGEKINVDEGITVESIVNHLVKLYTEPLPKA